MAIVGKYYTPETDLEEAYFKIDKVSISCNEYEILTPHKIDGDDREHDIVSYLTKYEGAASVKVYMDEASRKNLVRVVDTFTFTFEYNLDSKHNPFAQAYMRILDSGYIEDGKSA